MPTWVLKVKSHGYEVALYRTELGYKSKTFVLTNTFQGGIEEQSVDLMQKFAYIVLDA